jgi:hypothetical protein
MALIGDIGEFTHTMKAYAKGRGLLSTAVMLTTWGAAALNFSFTIPALVVAAGGAALSCFMRIHAQGRYEDNMIDLYREDIAKHLGIDPKTVTRANLKDAARDNEVIGQALARQRRINIVSFSTSALAAIATFGMLSYGLGVHTAVGEALTGFFEKYFGEAAGFLRYASVGIVSGITSLVLHNGLEEAIGYGTGLSKAAAHDLIYAMNRDVKHGKTITPEQVYAVLVTEDATLAKSIEQRFGESFTHMNPREQRVAMDALGVTADMTEIAGYITSKQVPAGRLAYMMHYAKPARPVAAATHANSAEPTLAPAVQQAERPGFVERLGLEPRAQRTYQEQVTAPPSAFAAAQAAR